MAGIENHNENGKKKGSGYCLCEHSSNVDIDGSTLGQKFIIDNHCDRLRSISAIDLA